MYNTTSNIHLCSFSEYLNHDKQRQKMIKNIIPLLLAIFLVAGCASSNPGQGIHTVGTLTYTDPEGTVTIYSNMTAVTAENFCARKRLDAKRRGKEKPECTWEAN